jgi:hypothetical protein
MISYIIHTNLKLYFEKVLLNTIPKEFLNILLHNKHFRDTNFPMDVQVPVWVTHGSGSE